MTRPALKESLLELQKFLKSFAKNFGLIIIILLTIVILLLPHFLKEGDLPLGKESYYHLKIAKDILDGKGLLSYYNFGWSALIAMISFIFRLPLEISINILSFLLGIISVILFYSILRIFDLNIRFISSLVLLISPIFIYLFIGGGRYTVPIVLSLLIAYFVFDKKYLKAGIAFVFVPFFDLGSAIFIALMFIFYFIYIKKRRLLLAFLLFVLLVLCFLYYKNFNLNFISDFGSEVGLSIFSLFLFFVGFGLFWRKKKFLLYYALCLILFLFYLKFNWILIYLNLFLALLVAVCFIELFNRKWESDIIKNLTLLLLICGLLFSGLSYAKTISEDVPDKEFFESLSSIPDNSVVFSSVDNKYWINYDNKNFIEFGENDYNELLMLRDAEISRFLLEKYNVKYILIDNNMERNIWKGKKDGLLWVLNYDTDHFINIYDGKNIDIWGFIEK